MTPNRVGSPQTPKPLTPRARFDGPQSPELSSPLYTPPTPEAKSARKKEARKLLLATETRSKEVAVATARKLSARRRLDARSLELATVQQESLLSHERRQALSPRSPGSPKTPWRDVASETAARSRAVMLEALRANQRHEESVAKALDAAQTERFVELRDRELRNTMREADAKRLACEQQEEEWLKNQRALAAAKAARAHDNFDAKERARRELEQATLTLRMQREEHIAKRKAEFAMAKERAERRRKEGLQQRAEQMAIDQSARVEREELRQFDRAVENARRKHLVYEEAIEKLTPLAIAYERLQKKAELMRAEHETGELPHTLATDLDRAAKRHKAMASRVQDLKIEAERAATDAVAIKKGTLNVKVEQPSTKEKK